MPGHPFAVNKAVFMDFRQNDPEVGGWVKRHFRRVRACGACRAFYTSDPWSGDRVFVEETLGRQGCRCRSTSSKRRLYRRGPHGL